jgi:hypothetical protein
MRQGTKGTVVQTWAEFHSDHLMAGENFINFGPGLNTGDIGLLNNATDGTYIIVWDCIAVSGLGSGTISGGWSGLWGITPNPTGVFTVPETPLTPNTPVGFGRTYTLNPAPGINQELFIFRDDPGTWEWPHDWPMAYLPPGFALALEWSVNVSAGSVHMFGSFIWEWGVRLR